MMILAQMITFRLEMNKFIFDVCRGVKIFVTAGLVNQKKLPVMNICNLW